MEAVLFGFVGVVVLASLIFAFLVFGMRGAHAKVRFEKIRQELKEQGRYGEWAAANRMLLTLRTIAGTVVWSGLPIFLLFNWLGLQQVGALFLVLFVICLLALVLINWILYNKIYQDLK
jgi:hypothetical protein